MLQEKRFPDNSQTLKKITTMKRAILILVSATIGFSALAQHTVVGTVTDCKGNLLSGVIVTVAESIQLSNATGSITDQDGNYTVSAPKDGTLLF